MTNDSPQDESSHSRDSTSEYLDIEVQQSVDLVAEQFLQELLDGTANLAKVVAAHPELAPHLEKRLKLLTALANISDSKQESSDSNSRTRIEPAEAARRINCPHCGIRIQLVQIHPIAEITCGACGSTIHVDPGSTRSATSSLNPGSIGRFEIRSLLGRGGFGCVYKARDPKLERMVAVKVPRDGYFATKNDRLRFVREARNAAKLRHHRIVQVHEVAEDAEHPYIVTELIDGLTLSDLISGRHLSFREIAKLVADISEAIDFAHEQGVIHRDIKPSNILLDHDQNPFVADFGLAMDTEAEVTMTLDGEILGTPAYMSPEQARGDSSKIDFRSDVYSLGVVLYRLLSGINPFRGSKRMMIHQVIFDDPPPPCRLNDHIPRDLEIITLKAMAKDPSDRYQTAGELVDDLNRWLNSEPILARPESPFGRFRKWCKRKPLVASLTISISCLLIVGGILSAVWAVRENWLKQQVAHNLTLAEERRQQSDLRLRQICLQNGLRQMQTFDHIDSLAWFYKASEVLEDAEDPTDLLRMNLILDQCPTLTHLWSVGEKVKAAGFSRDNRKAYAVNERNEVIVFDLLEREKIVRIPQVDSVYQVQFNETGDKIIVAAAKQAGLWSIEGPQQLATFQHTSPITRAAFSPKNRTVATASLDGTVKIWNADNGREIQSLARDGAELRWAGFFADTGHYLTVTTDNQIKNSTLTLWDLEMGQAIFEQKHPGQVVDVAIDPAGNLFATGSKDQTVRIWDVGRSSQVGQPLKHSSPIRHVFFGEDTNSIISVVEDGEITLWNARQAKPMSQTKQETAVNHSTLSPDRTLIASAFTDGRVRIRWLQNGQLVCSNLPCGTSAVRASIGQNSRRLLTAGNDGVLRIWDLAGASPNVHLLKHGGGVVESRFSPKGDRIVTCSRDGSGAIWDSSNGNKLGKSLTHKLDLMDCAFSPDGQKVVTVSADKTAQAWDAFRGNPIGPLREADSYFLRVVFGSDSKRYLAATIGGKAIAWDLNSPDELFSVSHEKDIRGLVVSPGGNRFATASADRTVGIWNASDGSRIGSPLEHNSRVTYCQFDPTEKWLATCSADGATIWNLDQTDEDPHVLKHKAGVTSCSFNFDGTRLLTTDFQGNASVWQIEEDRFSKEFEFELGNYLIMFGEFSPDGQMIVLSGERYRSIDRKPGNGIVYLLNAKDGVPLSPPLSHLEVVRRVHFGPKGDKLVSSSEDNAARVWDLKPGFTDMTKMPMLVRILTGQSVALDSIDENTGRRLWVSSREQQTAFSQLLESNPELFRCSSSEQKRWQDHVNWIRSTDIVEQ